MMATAEEEIRAIFEEEMEAMLAFLDSEYTSVSERVTKAQEALHAVEQKRITLRSALSIYREAHGLPEKEPSVDEVLRDRFVNKTAKEVLLDIARERNGILTGKEAVPIMIRAGMFSDARRASARFYSTVARFPQLFEWISRGKYRLLEEPVPTLSVAERLNRGVEVVRQDAARAVAQVMPAVQHAARQQQAILDQLS